MLCTKIHNQSAMEAPDGHFSVNTKSLFKAASDCAQVVGGEILTVTEFWAYVKDGKFRYLISKE